MPPNGHKTKWTGQIKDRIMEYVLLKNNPSYSFGKTLVVDTVASLKCQIMKTFLKTPISHCYDNLEWQKLSPILNLTILSVISLHIWPTFLFLHSDNTSHLTSLQKYTLITLLRIPYQVSLIFQSTQSKERKLTDVICAQVFTA